MNGVVMELSYEEVRRVHREEKNNTGLVKVGSDFYPKLRSFLENEKKSYLNSLKDFSLTKTRNFTNLKKMVEEIFSIREKKLLSKALIASRTEDYTVEGIPDEEKKVFQEIFSTLQQHNMLLSGLFESAASVKPASVEKALNTLSVRITSDIPTSFVGADMKEYGPYSKDAVVELPEKVARLLVSRKLGEVGKD